MDQFNLLRKIGLSNAGIACYKSLLTDGQADSQKLSKRLKIPQTNLYITLNALVEQGFVDKVKITAQPAFFRARPLDKALPEHYMYMRGVVMPLCASLASCRRPCR